MKLRVARHTNNFPNILHFYTELLGLELLGEFNNHDNYDGLFIGKPSLPWHLEFTRSKYPANHQPDEDDLLVFYPENEEDYQQIINRMEVNKYPTYEPKNPYWKTNGILYKDPDGFGVIISPLQIKPTN